MREYLDSSKYHLLATAAIFCLFIFSTLIRQEKLEAELFPGKEWITAHVLITSEIWDNQGGPASTNFCPIYTYAGKGNKHSTVFGGFKDQNHDAYYVSYPPFAFIFSYYSLKILGGNPLYSLRAINLILHFFCSYFIYLIFRILSSNKKDHFSISGVFCAFLYLFSSGTLWMHSTLYFADMLVQLFIILAIYLCIKLVQKEFERPYKLLILLSLVFFLATYTEWLGIFASLITGLAFLLGYIIKKEKNYLKAFIAIGISSSLAFGITLYQYSSIAGLDELVSVSQKKYDIRSGYEGQTISEAGFNIYNNKSYDKLKTDLTRNFLMVINLLGIFYILLIPLIVWKKSRAKMTGIHLKIIVIALLFLSILIHYVAFFNFNAVHNFSNLKTGLLLILTLGLALELIENSIPSKFKIALVGLLVFFGISRGTRDFRRYDNFYSTENMPLNRIASANAMHENAKPDYMAFSNLKNLNPEYIYTAKHVPFTVNDTNNIPFLMQVFEIDTGQYYYHENDTLKYILNLTLNGNHLNVIKTIQVNPN